MPLANDPNQHGDQAGQTVPPHPEPTSRTGRALPSGWVLVLTSLITLGSLYLWVVLTAPEVLGLDSQIQDLAARGLLPGSTDVLAAMSAGTNTGPLGLASLGVTVGIGIAFSMRRAATFGATILLSALTVTILKELVARARPGAGAAALSSFAWPSGHSAGALTFALAVTIALSRFGRTPGLIAGIALIPAAILVGYSRVFLSVHWFSDVAAGWTVSFFAIGLVMALETTPGPNARYRPAMAYGSVLAAVSLMVTMGLR